MLNDFFYNLSIRFRKENDLSDITWAMCQSCESFRNAFLRFFFENIDLTKEIIIEREKSGEGSRPDFVIDRDGLTYLIENKIYNHSHHFGQYDEAFNVPPSRFGYITNYKVLDEEALSRDYQLRTWEEFYDTLNNNLPEDEEQKQFLQGYLNYIENVCNMVRIDQPMKLDGLYSLFCLVQTFEKLSERDEQDFKLSIYSSNSVCGSTASRLGFTGVNFEVKYKSKQLNVKSQIWGWIGVYYNGPEPVIAIEFYNKPGWGEEFCKIILPYSAKWSDQETFIKPYFEEKHYLTFELSEDLHKKFNLSESVSEQEQILKSYMDEVLRYPIVLTQE